ncbi:MAG: hypothetical protein LBR56_03925 [Sporomusaceae bacterium]|jgi:hypothetical protein|nr:hypothetical protein [Sporomusaceae bacterium]
MFIDKYPKFVAGRVLKQEMLALLRNYPRDLAQITHNNYADGILSGCQITVDTAAINISPGLILFQKKIYTLAEPAPLAYQATGQDALVKVSFSKERETADYLISKGDLMISPGTKTAENELELCRFKLKEAARLRDNYQDFGDLATEYDTINIINAPYAAPYESTLSPFITRKFAEEALKTRPLSPFDFTFAAHCAQGEAVARILLTAYTATRLNILSHDSSNADIHRHLSQILSDIKYGKDIGNANNRRRSERKIFID